MSDPLADLLRSIRLEGAVFLAADFTEPWCIRAQITPADCAPFLVGTDRIICYHVVTEGRMRLTWSGGDPVEVTAGEVVIMPGNDLHELASGPGVPAVRATDFLEPRTHGALPKVVLGGGGAPTRLVCGFLAGGADAGPLLDGLPRLLKLDIRQAATRAWIESSVRFAAEALAAGRPAGSGAISRLSEMLLVEAIRDFAEREAGPPHGWLKALVDPQIGRALGRLHGDITTGCSVDALAREAAMSRSAFVDRFVALVGLPPIRYLTLRRMERARLLLKESRRTIGQIASDVGYASDEAFSRAFKRETGLSPGTFRTAAAEGRTAASSGNP